MTITQRQEVVKSFFNVEKDENGRYRAEGPHMGGVLGPVRLFGGHIVAQSYQVARQEMNGKFISSISYNFISAGSPFEPIFYEAKVMENLIYIKTYHGKKNIGHAHVKISEDLLPGPSFPSGIETISNVLKWDKQIWPKTWISNMQKEPNREKFAYEFRPVEFIHVHNKDNSVKYYARIQPDCLSILPENSGMLVAVALSDMFVIQPAINAYERKGFKMSTGASLHHKIHFHMDYVEASQWFFVHSRLELIENMKAKIIGTIFDSNQRPVLTHIQEAYCVHIIEETSKI